jgi:hypothetical protein
LHRWRRYSPSSFRRAPPWSKSNPNEGVAGDCYGRAGSAMGCRSIRYPSLDYYDSRKG